MPNAVLCAGNGKVNEKQLLCVTLTDAHIRPGGGREMGQYVKRSW